MASINRRNLLAAGIAFAGSSGPWCMIWGQEHETPEDRARRALEAIQRALGNPQEFEKLSETERRARYREMMRLAEEEDAKEVERLYSTRPIRFTFAGHTYAVPANYFGPKDFREERSNAESKGFGFYLFLPDYGGYTKGNWRDPFDRRKVTVVSIEQVEKNAIGTFTDGTRRPLSPDRFDPRVRFKNIRSLYEDVGVERYGLMAYPRKGGGATPGAIWAGTRSNGEFFYFQSSLAPGQPKRDGWPPNPLCDVRYYSGKEDLSIVYHYSQDHIVKWQEIDDAIWSKIRGWRVS